MTDTSSQPTTHSLSEPFPVTGPSQGSPLPNGSPSDTNLQDDEDYTIKCICGYADDDGNTVLCEKCDTWQHIECYYNLYGKEVPEVHYCADCSPRELDPKRATERQKRRREQNDGGDRKVKRPTSKSHKKKTKEATSAGDQVNGWHIHERHDSAVNGKDHTQPFKKTKTNHRPSNSIASLNGESRKRAFSNLHSYPSPSKSPQDHFRIPPVPTYTSEFLELYDRDEGSALVTYDFVNVCTIKASNLLSSYKTDPRSHPNGVPPFTYSDLPLNSTIWPKVSVEITEKPDIEIDGRHPTWRLLRAQTNISKDDLVGEIRGQVGMLEEYCRDPSSPNRWNELHHPDSFVFFHPLIPIYIDSRKQGTEFRYLRRSCQPNVTLKSFITSDGAYHHCFVASQAIPMGTELVAAWYLWQELFGKGLVDSEELQSKRAAWFSKVLANFGDCACDGPEPCRLAKLDCRIPPKSIDLPPKQNVGRKKKSKSKHAVSPLSTGQATNSRAGSEAIKPQEEDDLFDRRSTSTSSRSYPRSRDVTPGNTAILDANPILPDGLTAREKRKIAAVEKQFEKAEQETQERKRRKRTSGGSTLNTPNVNVSKQLGLNSSSNPSTPNVMQPYAESKSFRTFSGSPPPLRPSNSRNDALDSPCRPGSSRSVVVKPTYVNKSVQTDPEEVDVLDMPSSKRRKFSTPTQRLLRRVLEDRAKFEHLLKAPEPQSPPASTSPVQPPPAEQRKADIDVEMTDVSVSALSDNTQSPVSVISPGDFSKAPEEVSPSAPPFSMPSQAAHSQKTHTVPAGQKLHLSSLPPVPSFSNVSPGSNLTSNTAAMSATTPANAQSPMSFAVGATSFPGLSSTGITSPTPVRKKLSLGDYMSRRNLAAVPVVEKSEKPANVTIGASSELETDPMSLTDGDPHPAAMLQPDDSIKEEAASRGGIDGTAIEDPPFKEEPDYIPPDGSSRETESGNAAATQANSTAPTQGVLALSAAETAGQPLKAGGLVAPEVQKILAELRRLNPEQSKASTGSAS